MEKDPVLSIKTEPLDRVEKSGDGNQHNKGKFLVNHEKNLMLKTEILGDYEGQQSMGQSEVTRRLKACTVIKIECKEDEERVRESRKRKCDKVRLEWERNNIKLPKAVVSLQRLDDVVSFFIPKAGTKAEPSSECQKDEECVRACRKRKRDGGIRSEWQHNNRRLPKAVVRLQRLDDDVVSALILDMKAEPSGDQQNMCSCLMSDSQAEPVTRVCPPSSTSVCPPASTSVCPPSSTSVCPPSSTVSSLTPCTLAKTSGAPYHSNPVHIETEPVFFEKNFSSSSDTSSGKTGKRKSPLLVDGGSAVKGRKGVKLLKIAVSDRASQPVWMKTPQEGMICCVSHQQSADHQSIRPSSQTAFLAMSKTQSCLHGNDFPVFSGYVPSGRIQKPKQPSSCIRKPEASKTCQQAPLYRCGLKRKHVRKKKSETSESDDTDSADTSSSEAVDTPEHENEMSETMDNSEPSEDEKVTGAFHPLQDEVHVISSTPESQQDEQCAITSSRNPHTCCPAVSNTQQHLLTSEGTALMWPIAVGWAISNIILSSEGLTVNDQGVGLSCRGNTAQGASAGRSKAVALQPPKALNCDEIISTNTDSSQEDLVSFDQSPTVQQTEERGEAGRVSSLKVVYAHCECIAVSWFEKEEAELWRSVMIASPNSQFARMDNLGVLRFMDRNLFSFARSGKLYVFLPELEFRGLLPPLGEKEELLIFDLLRTSLVSPEVRVMTAQEKEYVEQYMRIRDVLCSRGWFCQMITPQGLHLLYQGLYHCRNDPHWFVPAHSLFYQMKLGHHCRWSLQVSPPIYRSVDSQQNPVVDRTLTKTYTDTYTDGYYKTLIVPVRDGGAGTPIQYHSLSPSLRDALKYCLELFRLNDVAQPFCDCDLDVQETHSYRPLNVKNVVFPHVTHASFLNSSEPLHCWKRPQGIYISIMELVHKGHLPPMDHGILQAKLAAACLGSDVCTMLEPEKMFLTQMRMDMIRRKTPATGKRSEVSMKEQQAAMAHFLEAQDKLEDERKYNNSKKQESREDLLVNLKYLRKIYEELAYVEAAFQPHRAAKFYIKLWPHLCSLEDNVTQCKFAFQDNSTNKDQGVANTLDTEQELLSCADDKTEIKEVGSGGLGHMEDLQECPPEVLLDTTNQEFSVRPCEEEEKRMMAGRNEMCISEMESATGMARRQESVKILYMAESMGGSQENSCRRAGPQTEDMATCASETSLSVCGQKMEASSPGLVKQMQDAGIMASVREVRPIVYTSHVIRQGNVVRGQSQFHQFKFKGASSAGVLRGPENRDKGLRGQNQQGRDTQCMVDITQGGRGGPVFRPEDGPVFRPEDGPVSWPEDGPVFRPEDGPVSWPEDGPVSWPEDGPVFRPDDGPVSWPEDGPVFRPEDGVPEASVLGRASQAPTPTRCQCSQGHLSVIKQEKGEPIGPSSVNQGLGVGETGDQSCITQELKEQPRVKEEVRDINEQLNVGQGVGEVNEQCTVQLGEREPGEQSSVTTSSSQFSSDLHSALSGDPKRSSGPTKRATRSIQTQFSAHNGFGTEVDGPAGTEISEEEVSFNMADYPQSCSCADEMSNGILKSFSTVQCFWGSGRRDIIRLQQLGQAVVLGHILFTFSYCGSLYFSLAQLLDKNIVHCGNITGYTSNVPRQWLRDASPEEMLFLTDTCFFTPESDSAVVGALSYLVSAEFLCFVSYESKCVVRQRLRQSDIYIHKTGHMCADSTARFMKHKAWKSLGMVLKAWSKGASLQDQLNELEERRMSSEHFPLGSVTEGFRRLQVTPDSLPQDGEMQRDRAIYMRKIKASELQTEPPQQCVTYYICTPNPSGGSSVVKQKTVSAETTRQAADVCCTNLFEGAMLPKGLKEKNLCLKTGMGFCNLHPDNIRQWIGETFSTYNLILTGMLTMYTGNRPLVLCCFKIDDKLYINWGELAANLMGMQGIFSLAQTLMVSFYEVPRVLSVHLSHHFEGNRHLLTTQPWICMNSLNAMSCLALLDRNFATLFPRTQKLLAANFQTFSKWDLQLRNFVLLPKEQ